MSLDRDEDGVGKEDWHGDVSVVGFDKGLRDGVGVRVSDLDGDEEERVNFLLIILDNSFWQSEMARKV